jgi:8-oxo-dGTP pyrophosphatase MutT (NUDIX family)
MIDEIRHPTASTFLFARFGAVWRMCVIEHPRHGGYLAPGGHVQEERNEAPHHAAMREVLEETGYLPRLLPAPLPDGYPHAGVAGAWWTVDIGAGADGRADVRHTHRDHIFVGVVSLPYEPRGTPELPVRWVDRDELEVLDTPTDTKVLGAHLFDVIGAAVRPHAAASPDEELAAELLRRQELDQEVRLLPRAARTPEVMERWKQIDLDNRVWLEQLVAARGWPGISEVGKRAAAALWLLALHSDPEPDFQLQCRDLLADAVLAGEADPQHGALLEDRVRVAQGRPQVFGTQLLADEAGELSPAPIWDAERVEQRRLEIGLEPMQDYLRACRKTAAG